MTGHLIHIGYAKTGSTFLRRWFSLHPQIAYVESGIAGLRDILQLAREGGDLADGSALRVTSCESLSYPHPYVGTPVATYDYSRWPPSNGAESVCRTLAALFPPARVLIVTRGFRSMILSSYSQYVRTGGYLDLSPFCEALRQRVDRGDSVYDYDRLAALYRQAFGEDRVIVLPWELLRDDPAAFTGAIEKQTGLEPGPPPEGRMNVSISARELIWYPRLTRSIRSLPLHGPFWRLYIRGTTTNRLRWGIAVLDRILPAGSLDERDLDSTVEMFRGKAESYRRDPFFAPYAREYLF